MAKSLIHWYSGAKRDLPWRKTKDPYIIWISEIILQQTRVDQGLPYFERFIKSFPTLRSLAEASEDSVLASWQGLGYYSRARNLHATAKHVASELHAKFPETYNGLIKLKGIGPYTAAAISSICFNQPKPVVDGNVFRVASRLFGITDDISKSSTRKIFSDVLNEIIPPDQPGEFNQAIMEHGATICKPRPDCDQCMLREYCDTFKNGSPLNFPVKTKKNKVTDRKITYMVVERNGSLLMKKRVGKDIWEGLYDFPLAESTEIRIEKRLPTITGPVVHLLSHQKLHVLFLYFSNLTSKEFDLIARSLDCEAFSIKQILTLPKPKIIVDYLRHLVK
ncbi:MAG: A/G-specific adenine glycosylase [Cytophagales bacterium]|nr:A/G-specific adenine glycosylase [Cytophagales bacterium]